MTLLLCAGLALAGGRVQWKSQKVKETDGGWKVEVTIFLSKAPDTSLVPVRFQFTPIAYYERALIDNHEGPVRNVIPLLNKQAMIEGVDIGFMDPGTGKLENRTRFTFRVTRARGYEAGEYEVEIKDARSDQTIGTKQRISLDGDNEVIDRRAMDFSKEDKPKKEEKKEADEPQSTAREYSPDDPAYWEGGPKEPEPKEDDRPPPASMREGGCGCRAAGFDTQPQSWAWVVLPLLALALRRQRS